MASGGPTKKIDVSKVSCVSWFIVSLPVGLLLVYVGASYFSHIIIFIHRRGGDVTLDYPDVTSLAHDVYFHIGHEQHDSMYCFHHMILLHYDISCAFIIGT